MTDRAVSPEFLGLQSAVAGRYSLDAEVGRGGMGIVYRAKDVTLDRVVAIKLLPPEQAEQADVLERFLREARTAARLSHPNIVPIFAVEELQEYVFFVMAYVDGETLAERVARVGPLNPHDAVRIFREVAWALGYAHAQHLVHRDIKPDNIMLERGTGRALVLDFGIAGDPSVEFGGVVGTPHFMSPEQASGETLGPATDFYSFGATMFFALAGRPPFDDDDAPTVLAHHIRTPPPRLSRTAPGTPTKISAIVEQCLMKEPADRFHRAEDLAEHLDRSIEAKKEVPVAVRAFVTHTRDRRHGASAVATVYLAMTGIPVLLGLFWFPLGGLTIVGLGLLALSAPAIVSTTRARKLLRGGFDRADLVRAFEQDYAQRVEELPFIYGDENARLVSRLRRISNGLLTAGVGAIAVGSASLFTLSGLGSIAPFGLLALLGGAMLRGVISNRSAGQERRRLKRWKGWFGKLVFKLARWRLKTGDDSAARLTHRPTEMAVGMAVLGLFESLPRATKQSLGDLPGVVAGLETDAQRMRQRVNDLDKLLAESAEDDRSDLANEDSLAGQRARAFQQIRSARLEASNRLGDAVAALESLRVDLLRIRAGEASLDSVTQNLGAARDVAEQVERILRGQEEVAEL